MWDNGPTVKWKVFSSDPTVQNSMEYTSALTAFAQWLQRDSDLNELVALAMNCLQSMTDEQMKECRAKSSSLKSVVEAAVKAKDAALDCSQIGEDVPLLADNADSMKAQHAECETKLDVLTKTAGSSGVEAFARFSSEYAALAKNIVGEIEGAKNSLTDHGIMKENVDKHKTEVLAIVRSIIEPRRNVVEQSFLNLKKLYPVYNSLQSVQQLVQNVERLADNFHLRCEIIKLNQKLQETRQASSQVEAGKKLQDENAELKKKLQESDDNWKQLIKELEKTAETALHAAEAEAVKQLKDKNAALESKDAELRKASEDVRTAQNAQAEAAKQLSGKDTEVNQLKETEKQLRNRIADLEEQITELNNAADGSRSAHTEETKRLMDSNAELSKKLKETEEKVNSQQTELENVRQSFHSAEEEATKQLKEKSAVIAKLEEDKAGLLKQINDSDSSLVNAQKQLEEKSAELQKAQATSSKHIAELKAAAAESAKKLADQKVNTEELKTSLQRMQDENQQSLEALAKLRELYSGSTEESQRLSASVQALDRQLEEYRQSLEKKDQECNRLNADHQNYLQQYNELYARSVALAERCDELQLQLKKVSDYHTIKSQLEECTAHNSQVILEKDGEISALKVQIEEYRHRSDHDQAMALDHTVRTGQFTLKNALNETVLLIPSRIIHPPAAAAAASDVAAPAPAAPAPASTYYELFCDNADEGRFFLDDDCLRTLRETQPNVVKQGLPILGTLIMLPTPAPEGNPYGVPAGVPTFTVGCAFGAAH